MQLIAHKLAEMVMKTCSNMPASRIQDSGRRRSTECFILIVPKESEQQQQKDLNNSLK